MAMPNIRHEELAVVVGQQSAKVDHCHNPDGKIDYVPLGKTGRPESMENGQEKCLGFCYKEEGAKKTSTWVVYTRKRRRPAGPKFEKSNTEQKLALFDSSNDSRVDKDLGIEPATPKRKRGSTAHSKCAKNKVVQKPLLVDSTSSSSDKYFEQEAVEGLLSLRMGGKCTGEQAGTRHLSHGDDDQKKSTRVKGTALDRAGELKRKLTQKGLSFIKHMTPLTQIVKTVKIAEGIMASSSTSLQDLAAWRKRLESLERLGMDVSFMCKRVDDLIELITTDPPPAEVDPERYAKAKLERDGAAKNLRAVEASVSILKDALKEIDAKMEEMVQAGATKKMEQAMRKLATPW